MSWKDSVTQRTAHELQELIAVCKGSLPANLIIKDGNLVNVHTGEIYPADVAIKGERIALVGDISRVKIGQETRVIRAEGKYLTPGLIDPHFHSYHAQQNITQFARLVLPHGTTTIADSLYGPGMISSEAIKFFVDEYKRTPLKLIFLVPTITYLQNRELGLPRVFDTLTMDRMLEMLDWPECFGLEEPPADVALATEQFPEMLSLFAETLKRHKVITGHAWGAKGSDLNAYISAGVSSDHEGDTRSDAIERARLGMWVLMREGSAASAVKRLIKAVTEERLDSRYFSFSVDVGSALRLKEQGHVDESIRVAISCGLNPIRAVQMATLNAAEALGIARDMGSIAPGRFADILLVDDLPGFRIATVVANGNIVAQNGESVIDLQIPSYPAFLKNTIRVPEPITEDDFVFSADSHKGTVEVRVIEVREDSLYMPEGRARLRVRSGCLEPDIEHDVLKIVMLESFKGTRDRGKGFIRGFKLKRGAIGSTHNSFFHGVNIVGTNDRDMCVAAKALVETGGGEVAVANGKVLALLDLPLCGVLSADTLETALQKSSEVAEATRELGCPLKVPFRSLAFTTACGNLGELKIFDRGLVHVGRRKVVDLIVH